MASQPHDDEDNGFDQALHDAGIGHLATPGSASKKKLTQILRGLLSEVNKLTQPQLDTLENKLLPEESTGDKMLRSIGDLGMDRRKFLQGTAAGAATLAAGKSGLLKGAAPAAEAAAPVAEAAAAPLYHVTHPSGISGMASEFAPQPHAVRNMTGHYLYEHSEDAGEAVEDLPHSIEAGGKHFFDHDSLHQGAFNEGVWEVVEEENEFKPFMRGVLTDPDLTPEAKAKVWADFGHGHSGEPKKLAPSLKRFVKAMEKDPDYSPDELKGVYDTIDKLKDDTWAKVSWKNEHRVEGVHGAPGKEELIDLDLPLKDQSPMVQQAIKKGFELEKKKATEAITKLRNSGQSGPVTHWGDRFKRAEDYLAGKNDELPIQSIFDNAYIDQREFQKAGIKGVSWQGRKGRAHLIFDEERNELGGGKLPAGMTSKPIAEVPPEELHTQSTQKLLQEAQAAQQAGVPVPKEIQAEIDEAMAEAAPQDMGKSKLLDSLRALVRPAAQAASPSSAPVPQTPAMPIKQMPLLQPPPKPLDGDNHNPYEGL